MQERPPVTLSSRLQTDLTQAIRDRDELRRDTLRMAISAAYNTQKAAGRELTDDEVLAVLTREVKTRRESIDAYTAAGRTDAAAKEQAEIEIISAYLPAAADRQTRSSGSSRKPSTRSARHRHATWAR